MSSALVPPLAGENFQYTIKEVLPDTPPVVVEVPSVPADTVVPPTVPVDNAPVIVAPSKGYLQGKGKNLRLVLEGGVFDEQSLQSLEVSIVGRRVPVSGTEKWKTAAKVSKLLKWISPKTRTITMTIIAKDANGATSAVIRRVRIPSLAKYAKAKS